MDMSKKKKIIFQIAMTAFFCILFISCATVKHSQKKHRPLYSSITPESNDVLLKKSYKAADYLNRKLKKLNLANRNILITTFSNNENLESSNSLGRLIPYLIGTNLSHLGYNLVDLRLRKKDIKIKPGNGEFILTRNLGKLNKDINVSLILTGHYSIIANKIYIHCEIISPIKNMVLSSYDFVLPYKIIEDPTKEGIIIPSVKTS